MRPSTFAFVLALACVAASAPSALADVTTDQCIDSNAKAQALRRSGKLSAAREQLATCVDRACPAMVRDDCAKRLDELDRLQPTIVLGAQDANGVDVIAVSVSIDGRPLTSKLDGRPLEVDPGPHVFEFQSAGRPTETRTLVLKEGEKGRIEITSNDFRTDPQKMIKELPPREEIDKWQRAQWQAKYHMQDWLDCMKSRKLPLADVETGHRSISVCHLANIARQLNRKLQWDPEAERFVGDSEANDCLSRQRRKGYELPEV